MKKAIVVSICILAFLFFLVKYLVLWSVASIPSLILDNAISTMIPSDKESTKALKQFEYIQKYTLICKDVEKHKDEKIETLMRTYFSDCDEVKVTDDFSIDWTDIMTVDSIRVQQNFKNFDRNKALEIGKCFIVMEKSKHKETRTRTIKNKDGTKEKETYEVLVGRLNVYKSGFDNQKLYQYYLKNNPEKSVFTAEYISKTLHEIYIGEDNEISEADLVGEDGNSMDSSEHKIEGENITPLIYYNQCVGPWADKVYGGPNQSTYRRAGCGPTAAAIIFASLKNDKRITPETMGNFFIKKGLRASNGTTHNCMVVSAKKYGLKSEFFSQSAKKLAEHLRKGHIVSSVQGRNKNELYSGKGHFIVINGIREQNGKIQVYVTDPGYRKKIGWWDINTVVEGSKNMTAVYQ